MSPKRELQDLGQAQVAEPGPKRAKRQTGATPRHQHQNSSIDPTWGQKYVFSSSEDATTIPYGEESDFEDDADAMAYLQSVRREAYNIPHLLVAPKVQIGPQLPPGLRKENHDDDEHDTRDDSAESPPAYTAQVMQGYYDDGAYVAMPGEDWKADGEDAGYDTDPQADARAERLHESYLAALMRRYARLRRLLHSEPPADWATRLTATQVTHAAPFGRNSTTNKLWARLLRDTDPHPLQLALMSKDTVIRILHVLLGGNFLQRSRTLSERTSHWIWGLLARLPERGELNHSEIGCIRDLGRHAVLLGISLDPTSIMRDGLPDGKLGDILDDWARAGDEEAAPIEDDEAADGDAEYDVLASQESGSDDGHGSAGEDEENQHGDAAENAAEDEAADQKGAEEEEEEEEGEIQDGSFNGDDVAMDLDSGSEEGGDPSEHDNLEAAKMNLLARLDSDMDTPPQPLNKNDAQQEARLRRRVNTCATMTMILTVAGEFYGQRDLLEYRSPFGSV